MAMLEPGFSQALTEPQQTMRASAALPAAGAYDAAPLAIECMGWTHMTLLCTYTRGALGGAVTFYLDLSYGPAPTVYYRMTCYQAGALAVGADVASNVQRETLTYGSQGAAAERFAYDLIIPSNIKNIRLAAAESGVVGTPGTFAVNASFRS